MFTVSRIAPSQNFESHGTFFYPLRGKLHDLAHFQWSVEILGLPVALRSSSWDVNRWLKIFFFIIIPCSVILCAAMHRTHRSGFAVYLSIVRDAQSPNDRQECRGSICSKKLTSLGHYCPIAFAFADKNPASLWWLFPFE